MKNLAWVLIFGVGPLFSLPVGNTAFPEIIQEGFFAPKGSWVDVRSGYEGDFIYDGRMKQEQEGSGRVDTYKQTTNSGTVTLDFVDRLDLYGVFGSSDTRAEWRFTVNGVVNNACLETRYNFLWGVGLRAILFQWGHLDLGAGARYASCNYKPSWLTINGVNHTATGTHLRVEEWQVNLDISYKIDLFTPYGGVKYQSVKTRLGQFNTPIASNGSGGNHFSERNPVGMYVGCSLSTGKYFMLNVEGRFIDEEAITISGDVKF